jgi:hypothetical protein
MSYEPKWYIVQYEVDGEEEQETIQAEDAYEAISLLRVNVPDVSIDAVYVQVELYNDEDEEDNDDGTNE